ncbi:MAG: D-aminoacylase, partial [Planctomycetota bacterium]|nr:D-aminoacylase [Planctomycetota bacterium]
TGASPHRISLRAPGEEGTMGWDFLIKGGLVVDGTGSPAFRADVAVENGRIAEIGPDLARAGSGPASGATVIEAAGRVVCPGFIDAHAHGELEPLADPSAASKVLGGVTTEICGNCGFSPFPLVGAAREAMEPASVEIGIERDWTTAAEYFERLEKRGSAINRTFLVGHGTVRSAAGALGAEPLSPRHMPEMRRFVEEALEAGCIGMSTGLIYPPGCFSSTDEIVGLAPICARKERIYTSHIRGEGNTLIEAVEEALEIGRRSGVRVQISHLKVSGRNNWHKIGKLEDLLHSARREGLDFHADQYPYTATCTGLDAVLPKWAYEGGVEREMERLEDDYLARRMEQEINERAGREGYWDEVMILWAGDKMPALAGRTASAIASEWKTSPFEAVRRILIETKCRASAVYFSLSEEIVRRIMRWDFVMIGSDSTARNVSGPTARGRCHPRTFGTFPRILGRYVRVEKVLSLEDAVRKMTSLPADTFRLKDRGRMACGCVADIVVFDPEKVEDTATFESPMRFPVGIEHVLVAGRRVVAGGRLTGELPGRVLRAG